MSKFHENLKNIRIKNGFTAKYVYELLSVAKSTYSQYENGTREPDFYKISLLCEILNTTPNDLFGIGVEWIDGDNNKNLNSSNVILDNYLLLSDDCKDIVDNLIDGLLKVQSIHLKT